MKSVSAGPGRVGTGRSRPGRFIPDIDYIIKKNTFLFNKQYQKSLVSEVSRCFDFPYECGKKVLTASSLRGARKNYISALKMLTCAANNVHLFNKFAQYFYFFKKTSQRQCIKRIPSEHKQVKCEVIEKTSQGASNGRCQTYFVLTCCMSCGRSLSVNVGGRRLGDSSYQEIYYC